MAKPIKETPVLKGKDACNFVNEMNKPQGQSVSQAELNRIRENFEKINALVRK
jgi:hypothetical protein